MAKKKEVLSLEEKLEKALVPDWEQPYKVPSNWVWTRLDQVCKLANGIKQINVELPYLEVKYLRGKIDGNTKDKGNYIEKGSKVILVDGENSGEVFHIFENGYMGSTFKKLDVDKSVDQRMFEMFLATHKDEFRNSKTGSAIPHLNKELFREMPIPLPPLAEQKRIVERIESLFSKLDEAKELAQLALDSFENRKAAILHKAFTGELTRKWREENRVGLDSWEEKTLQQVCANKITDGTHQTPKYSDKENGMPFISSKDVTSGKIDWSKIKYITKELHEELYKRVAPQIDDVLLAKNGTTGVAAIVEDDLIFDIYVTLALLRPNKAIINPRYLYNIVNSPICKEQFNSHLTGIGVPNLHLRDIREVLISLPTLQEQKEIVRILNIFFEKETKAKECANVIEQIDLMKKVILARAFRGELGTNDESDESAMEFLKNILEEKRALTMHLKK
ncbi:MAG: restriction endonuclease subunit S [Eubacteriales bacterium]